MQYFVQKYDRSGREGIEGNKEPTSGSQSACVTLCGLPERQPDEMTNIKRNPGSPGVTAGFLAHLALTFSGWNS